MMGLLVYKEKLKNFYAEHEFYVNPIIKFISAFIALTLIKKNVGYNDLLTMWPYGFYALDNYNNSFNGYYVY